MHFQFTEMGHQVIEKTGLKGLISGSLVRKLTVRKTWPVGAGPPPGVVAVPATVTGVPAGGFVGVGVAVNVTR